MRENDIRARSARLYRSHAALKAFHLSVPNRSLDKLADAPDRLWVGDVTYLWVAGRWRFLAVVMDRYSRRIVGWSYGPERNTGLTLRALNHAIQNRRPGTGLIFHTDRGIEYSAQVFRDRLGAAGIVQSMNRPREMNDNAHMESFFGTMKADVIHGERFHTDPAVRRVVRSYIPFYNQTRKHTSLGNKSPTQYEYFRSKQGVN
jgi:transposase InsO family protein